jgi:hypothetical protein
VVVVVLLLLLLVAGHTASPDAGASAARRASPGDATKIILNLKIHKKKLGKYIKS